MGGKSRSYVSGYRIKRGIHSVISTAPIDAITAIEFEGETVWEGYIESGRFFIDAPNVWGGDDKLGGCVGPVSVLNGSSTQPVNSYLTGVLPAPHTAFRDVSSVVFEQIEQGKEPSPKRYRVKAQNVFASGWNLATAAINPESVLRNANIYLALDASRSMEGQRIIDQYNATQEFLENLKGFPGNSIKIVVYSEAVEAQNERLDANDTDIDELIAWIDTLGTTVYAGTHYDEAVSLAGAFFNAAPQNSVQFTGEDGLLRESTRDRRNIIVFLTDGQPTGTTLSGALSILAGLTVPYELFAFNIDDPDTTSTAQLDNTPQDGVPVITSGSIGNALLSISPFWVDGNGVHMMREALTDSLVGGRYSAADIGSSFATVAQTLFDEGLGLSFPPAALAEGIANLKSEIERHIDGYFYRSRQTGKWEAKLNRNDYSVASLFRIDPSLIVEWVDEPEFPDPDSLPNQVTLTYTRRTDGDPASITENNQVSVGLTGVVVPDENPPNYPGITFDQTAADVLQREMVARTLPIATGAVRVAYVPHDLTYGDPFVLNDPRVQISDDMVCRVREIIRGDTLDNSAVIHWAEDRFRHSVTQGFSGESAPSPAVNIVTAAPLLAEVVRETPYWQHVFDVGQSNIDEALVDDPDLGTWGASGAKPNTDATDVVVTVQDGSIWRQVATAEFTPHLVLSANIDGQASSMTFTCEYNASADVIAQNDILTIDGEEVRVDAASRNGSVVTLTAGRGCLDTVPVAHAAGSVLMLAEPYIGGDGIQYTGLESLNIKNLTRARGGDVLSPSSAPTQALTLNSRAIRPYPVGNFRVNGSYAPAGLQAGNVTLTWAHRDRLQQTTGSPEDHTASDIGPEANVEYFLVRRWVQADGTVDYSETGATLSQVTTTVVDVDDTAFSANVLDTTRRLSLGIETRRGGYTNWQTPFVDFEVLLSPLDLLIPAAGTAELSWTNRSPNADQIRVYRGTSNFDENSLPLIVGTLPADAESFSQTPGVGTFFYAVASVANGIVALSNVVEYTLNQPPRPADISDGQTSSARPTDISDGGTSSSRPADISEGGGST